VVWLWLYFDAYDIAGLDFMDVKFEINTEKNKKRLNEVHRLKFKIYIIFLKLYNNY